MKKLLALLVLSSLAFTGCVSSAINNAYEKEYNYQRAHQQSQKGFNELDKQ